MDDLVKTYQQHLVTRHSRLRFLDQCSKYLLYNKTTRMLYDPSKGAGSDYGKDASIEAEAANRGRGIFKYLESVQFISKGLDIPSPQPPRTPEIDQEDPMKALVSTPEREASRDGVWISSAAPDWAWLERNI
jgi:hypothetical protein